MGRPARWRLGGRRLRPGGHIGLVAAPCGAPAFAAVLTFVSTTGSALLGFLYLFVFSLGLTALLVAVGLFSGSAGRSAAGREVDPLDQAGRRRAAAADGRVLLRQDGKRAMRDRLVALLLAGLAVAGAAGAPRNPAFAVGLEGAGGHGARSGRQARWTWASILERSRSSSSSGPRGANFARSCCPGSVPPRPPTATEVEFLGINVTVNQSRDRVRRYLDKHKPPFRTLYDDEGTSTRAYEAPATSYVVIVDRRRQSRLHRKRRHPGLRPGASPRNRQLIHHLA